MATLTSTLAFDADGVLVDSRAVAFKAAADIVGLFNDPAAITTRDDYNAAFGAAAQKRLAGEDGPAYLRALHRLLMRARAGQIGVFEECLAVVQKMNQRPLLITAAYAAGIRQALGDRANLFLDIHGRECGNKETLLQQAADTGVKLYVTDTVRDITRCRACGISIIAVTWGYDPACAIADAKPDFIVEDAAALTRVLGRLSLL
jgi:phosphoglycolate phosphatase-like HAD superfamily hydrolase